MAGAAPADEDGSPKKTEQGGFKTMPFILGEIACLCLISFSTEKYSDHQCFDYNL
jgi:hypothetical protein